MSRMPPSNLNPFRNALDQTAHAGPDGRRPAPASPWRDPPAGDAEAVRLVTEDAFRPLDRN